jgi:suppressor of G2 allele of SKP1
LHAAQHQPQSAPSSTTSTSVPEPTIQTWIRKAQAELSERSPHGLVHSSAQPLPSSTSSSTIPAPSAATPAAVPPAVVAPVASGSLPPAARLKHDWYQTGTDLFLNILQKQLPADQCRVEFEAQLVRVHLPASVAPGPVEFRLADSIQPEQCAFQVLGTKLEIRLRKLTTGVQWRQLEAAAGGESAVLKVPASVPASSSVAPAAAAKPRKNWDALAADLTKDADAEEDPLQKLFKDIYGKGTPEQQRAMAKSFSESGGTVLSTNWDDVGKREVVPTPPDGMVAKKWNS